MKIINIKDRFYIEDDVNITKSLSAGNYLLHFDSAKSEYFLKRVDDFIIPEKVYGNEKSFIDRCLNSFSNSRKNMGVLLTGIKGSGKSLTAKMLCKESNLPTIIITECFKGVLFKQFLQSIKQQVIIFIDEFEKIYSNEDDKNDQEEFLPILDGTFDSNKLFLFTTNSMKINKFLKNRPNRIKYIRKFDGLEVDVIQEVIDNLLEDKTKEAELHEILEYLSTVSMDVLLHIIQEMNSYNETAREVMRYLNVQIEHSLFNVRLYIDGKLYYSQVEYNPLTSKTIYVPYKFKDDRYGYDRQGYYEKDVKELNLSCIDGKFEYSDRENNTIVFEPTKAFTFSL